MGRDGIRDSAKLNSLLIKMVKKSLENATKTPKIEMSEQLFFAFWPSQAL